MINNQKYKINTMAKDLNMKSKDLLDLFTKLGMTGRKHPASPITARTSPAIAAKSITIQSLSGQR